MYHPTTRALTILDLLQSYGKMTGKEFARRLEVDPRTIRRYITMLQDMGIPIEAERGREGAYFLRPGFKLPPLMFTSEEAFVVALSLRLAKQTALYGAGVVFEGVSAKIERVLPQTMRQQVQVVLNTLSFEVNLVPTVATSSQVVLVIAIASQLHQSVRLKYQKFDGTVTQRTIAPYGVAYRVGRWYVVGFCHLRNDIRTFRLDRVLEVETLEVTFEPRSLNIMEHIERALAKTPGIHQVEVLFEAPINTVQRYIPTALGELVELDTQQTQLLCFVQSLAWFAGFLAGIPLSQKIVRPEALQQEMISLVNRVRDNLSS